MASSALSFRIVTMQSLITDNVYELCIVHITIIVWFFTLETYANEKSILYIIMQHTRRCRYKANTLYTLYFIFHITLNMSCTWNFQTISLYKGIQFQCHRHRRLDAKNMSMYNVHNVQSTVRKQLYLQCCCLMEIIFIFTLNEGVITVLWYIFFWLQ